MCACFYRKILFDTLGLWWFLSWCTITLKTKYFLFSSCLCPKCPINPLFSVSSGRTSPSVDPLRKSPTADPALTPAAPSTAPTVPAPGLGHRSPAHGRTAPSGPGQTQKPQHQDISAGGDARRGETKEAEVEGREEINMACSPGMGSLCVF